MNETSYEVLKRPLESDLPEQIAVRVRRERRRRWAPAEKLRIVQEAFAPGAIAKRVADSARVPTAQPRLASGADGVIEIDMPSGARVRVGHGVDLKVLRGVLAALDGH